MTQWILVVFSLAALLDGASAEWTDSCPTGCVCMWIGGRKTAECRDGGFTTIPKGLSEELQILDLRGNAFSILRNYAFRDAGLVNLHKLKLTHCQIMRVERYAFADLKILVELDLSDNEIKEWSMDSFDTNDRLREFQISGNPLSKLLGASFPPLQHFQKLSLRGCNLSTIPPRAFEQLTALEQLDLSSNQFQTLSEHLFENLSKLKAVSLHDNPWKCDCQLKGLRDWALSNKLLGIQPPKCSQPDRLANFEWTQLLTSHFACPPEIVAVTVSGHWPSVSGSYVVSDANVGKTVRLECLVKANPPADVRWVRDSIGMSNSTATANGKLYFVQVSGEAERWVNVTFVKTNLGDAGDYTCVGENKAGSVERNVTLNFEAIISGGGVGVVGGAGGGVLVPSQSWIWILIICLGALLTLTILLILLLCLCYRRIRKPPKEPRVEFKGDEPLMTSRENTLKRSKVNQENGFIESSTPLLTPSQNYEQIEGDPDYPDLLDLPRRRGATSPVDSTRSRSPGPPYVPQTLAGYYRRPLELTPTALYDPTTNGVSFPLALTLPRRPHSPFSGSVASFASEPPQQRAIVPPPHRPGYVTLPRRPRLNTWTPRTGQRSHSPGAGLGTPAPPFVKYDNLGRRTTADGSSRHSLNKLDDGGNYPSSTLPAYPRGRGHQNPTTPATPHFSFDPIQEHGEGPGNDVSKSPENGKNNPDQSQGPPAAGTPATPEKKVPPKPPPKPKKKANGTVSPEPIDSNATPQREDDGTEI